MPSDDIYRHLFGGKGFHPYFRTGQKEKRMEIVTIEAQTFLEMNRALEALAKKCGKYAGKIPGVWMTG